MLLAELIEKRHSLRRFSDRPVAREDLARCLEAARLAPSACNSQPWKFVVVDDPKVKTRLSERIFSGIYSMNDFAKEAPVLIAVVSEKMKFLAGVGAQVRGTQYYLVDIGIACEHLVLQAQELGIGSCWMGWFHEKALKQELHIPWDRKVDIVIALGYPREEKTPAKVRKKLEQIHSFNRYENG